MRLMPSKPDSVIRPSLPISLRYTDVNCSGLIETTVTPIKSPLAVFIRRVSCKVSFFEARPNKGVLT